MSNATITASVGRAAMAAALLVVERVEFRTPAMTDLLIRRSDVVKPIVVTSTEDRSTITDPHLARIFVSQLRDLPLTRAPQPSPHEDAR